MSIVEDHRYRDEIVELLAAGWSATSVNARLSHLHRDYQPVSKDALWRYRRDHIPADQMRPMELYERKLADEHVLLDPIRAKAALIVLQQGRLQKAVSLEEKLPGAVLPLVGAEIERLSRLWIAYEDSLERAGFTSHVPDVSVSQQVNILSLEGIPPELQAQMAQALARARNDRAAARMREVETRVRASLPDSDVAAQDGTLDSNGNGHVP